MPARVSRDDREKKIQHACEQLLREKQNGGKPNIKQAARDFGVSYSTLHARFNNVHKSPAEAREAQHFIGSSAEHVLFKWVEHLGETGVPMCKKTIRARAQHLHPQKKKPSRNWVYSFLERHPTISFFTSSGLDPKRAQAFNQPVVGRFFDKLTELVTKHDIPIENIYNMDEKGVQRGGGKKASRRKYLYSRKQRAKYKHRSANLELITIIEAVCADGTKLKPGFVFSGSTQCPEWFDYDDEIVIAMSPNGWTDDFIGSEWFRLSFIPQATARNKSGKPILLILDGHGSHETITIIDLAEEHNIIVLLLPPHTTHKLQPLDVGIFGPFSRKWIDRCDDIVILIGSEMRKEDFIKEYMGVRDETFRSSVIISAFKKSGIWPINRDVFTAEDYAPSIPYSTAARDVPDLPEYSPTVPILPPHPAVDQTQPRKRARGHDSDSSSDSDSSDSDSDSSDSDFDSDSDEEPETPCIPRPDTTSSLPAPAASTSVSVSTSRTATSSPTPLPSMSASTRSTQSPLPATHFYHDPVLFARISQLESEVQGLQAHVGMVESELAMQKRKLNERDGRASKRRKLNVEARVLTSVEGRRLAAEKDAERANKAQKKSDGAQRRREKENCREEARRNWDPNTVFTGILSAKNKDDLMNIAWSLGLSDDGTKATLLESINKHFSTHPAKRDSEKYKGLFARAQRGRRATAPAAPGNQHDAEPSASHIPSSAALENSSWQNRDFTFAPPPIHSQYGSWQYPRAQHPFHAPLPSGMANPHVAPIVPLNYLTPFDAPFNTYNDFENGH